MVQSIRSFTLVIFAVSLGATLACSTATPTNTNSSKTPTTLAPEKKTKATGTITADPNPVKVCDGTGAGITKLTWSASGTYLVAVRIGSPDGIGFAETGPTGSKLTGKWVGNGTVVYLQDLSEGKQLTSENTIATVVISVTTEGCP